MKKKIVKVPKWKLEQKSIHRELGWGSMKEGCDKKAKNKQWVEYNGRLICKCGERRTTHIQEARADYWYCDMCGFEGDIDSWTVERVTGKNREVPRKRYKL